MNRSQIFKAAWQSFKAGQYSTFGQALKAAWWDTKNPVIDFGIAAMSVNSIVSKPKADQERYNGFKPGVLIGTITIKQYER